MSIYVNNAVAKVVFTRTLKNGTTSCWFKIKKTSFAYMVKYWLGKSDFYYLKLYKKNDDGSIGNQIGYISRSNQQYTP